MFPRLQDFRGDWRITRQIVHADGTSARFEGRATFSPRADTLLYQEQGELQLASGHSMRAERRYVWAATGPQTLALFFEDGRPFHQITAQTCRDTHWCDPDTYDVSYDFRRWPTWCATWIVTGPRKDYAMTSHYERA